MLAAYFAARLVCRGDQSKPASQAHLCYATSRISRLGGYQRLESIDDNGMADWRD